MKKIKKIKKGSFKNWVEKNPKTTFAIMIAMTIASITFTLANYSSREQKGGSINNVFKGIVNESEKNFNSNIKYLEYQSYKEELSRYLMKETLTGKDSLRIEYLINKLNQDE